MLIHDLRESRNEGIPRKLVKQTNYFESLQDITPYVEFLKLKKLKGKNINVTRSLRKKSMEAPKKAREF